MPPRKAAATPTEYSGAYSALRGGPIGRCRAVLINGPLLRCLVAGSGLRMSLPPVALRAAMRRPIKALDEGGYATVIGCRATSFAALTTFNFR